MSNINQSKEKISKLGELKIFSIKYKLMLIFGLLTVLVVVLLVVTTLNFAQKAVFEKVEKQLKEKAIDAATIVEGGINEELVYIKTVSRLLLKNNTSGYLEKAKLLAKEAELANLKGFYICDTLEQLYLANGKKIYVGDREFYQKAIKGSPFITEPYIDRVTGDLVVSVASPLYDKNKNIIGVILVDFQGLILNQYIENIDVGKDGDAYIVGRSGVTIADVDPEIVINMENSTEVAKNDPTFEAIAEFEQKALSEDEPAIGYFYWGGVENIGAFAKVPSTGWAVIIFDDANNFLETIETLKIVVIVIGFIILALALLITFFISPKIRESIQ